MSSLAATRADGYYFPKDFDPNKHKSLAEYNREKKREQREKRKGKKERKEEGEERGDVQDIEGIEGMEDRQDLIFEERGKSIGDLKIDKKAKEKKEEVWKAPQSAHKVRFEMMFQVRCLNCHLSTAKGVRFNAIKKTVGKYHSTEVYEFLMKCPHCVNVIIIRTDPRGGDYIVVEGAKRILRVDPLPMPNTQQRTTLEKLESQEQDRTAADLEKPRLQALQDMRQVYREDYEANRNLRKIFREDKKKRESLGIEFGHLNEKVLKEELSQADKVR